jgi:hypothetical protein
MADKKRVVAIPKAGETEMKQVPHEDRKRHEEKNISAAALSLSNQKSPSNVIK